MRDNGISHDRATILTALATHGGLSERRGRRGRRSRGFRWVGVRKKTRFATAALGQRGRVPIKNLEKDLLGLEALQPIEIPQNRQRNLWKGLEQNSLDLERLGKKLGGRRHRRPRTLAGDRPGHPRREGGGLSGVCRNMVHARKHTSGSRPRARGWPAPRRSHAATPSCPRGWACRLVVRIPLARLCTET